MGRSKWKNPFRKITKKNNKKIYASRSSEIMPEYLGLSFIIHNGNKNKEITVNDNMIGHKFGEFFFTRSKYVFKKKKKK